MKPVIHGKMKFLRPVGRHFRTTLVAGVLFIVPVGVTFLILKFIFDFFDPLLEKLLEQFMPVYPGMGIVALLILIYVAGLVAAQVVGKRLIQLGITMVDRIPVVNGLYRAARQATDVFSKVKATGGYSSVVLVDFPGYGLTSIGLVTGKLKDQQGNTLLAVYLPNSPLPTSGFLIILPEDQVTATDLPVEDAIRMLVSAGVLSPATIRADSYPFQHAPTVGRTKSASTQVGAEQTYVADNVASNQ